MEAPPRDKNMGGHGDMGGGGCRDRAQRQRRTTAALYSDAEGSKFGLCPCLGTLFVLGNCLYGGRSILFACVDGKRLVPVHGCDAYGATHHATRNMVFKA